MRLSEGEPYDGPGVVHDLGNLIQIAASAVNLVMRNPRAGRDPSLEPVLARARTALERAGVLVRDSMDRIREPTVVVWRLPEEQDLSDCLHEIHGLIDWVCAPDIRLSIDIAADLPHIRCNRIDLQNALLNLVINARDAMPDGGDVAISARVVGEEAEHRRAEIRVQDNGAGMSPETLRLAFNPYFSTKPEGRGTGLGLAMVRRFAHEAGGCASIASTPGIGTTVTLHLPAQPHARRRTNSACGAEIAPTREGATDDRRHSA
jgi:signal transduction histidine kinase